MDSGRSSNKVINSWSVVFTRVEWWINPLVREIDDNDKDLAKGTNMQRITTSRSNNGWEFWNCPFYRDALRVAIFFEEFLAAFLDAKVILTVRDNEQWYTNNLSRWYLGMAVPRGAFELNRFYDSVRWINSKHLQAKIPSTHWARKSCRTGQSTSCLQCQRGMEAIVWFSW